MGVDHSKALVRITFNGLFIICRKGVEGWEVGIPNVTRHAHTPDLKLVTITGAVNPVTETPNIRLDQDISISTPPTDPLSTVLFDPVGFHRQRDTGDPEDYRWILDMEGLEFHNKKLTLRPGGGYKAKIFIKGGQLYTAGKTVEIYRRDKKSNPAGDRIVLGKAAITAGINLERNDADSRTINLQNVGGAAEPIQLRQRRGVRYELRFTHMPVVTAPTTTEPTHFDHYYDVLKADEADTMYDVLVNTPFPEGLASALAEVPAAPATHAHGHDDKSQQAQEEAAPTDDVDRRGTEPQVCNSIYLGRSDGLPL
ncbi:MAG TPA: hypothetical protein VGP08_02205 [Pyrinomonadaceae bacterium]|jgi:hypothetical protein|nr:hypothetical protein [Pyrinomonadaceae bacterium]